MKRVCCRLKNGHKLFNFLNGMKYRADFKKAIDSEGEKIYRDCIRWRDDHRHWILGRIGLLGTSLNLFADLDFQAMRKQGYQPKYQTG